MRRSPPITLCLLATAGCFGSSDVGVGVTPVTEPSPVVDSSTPPFATPPADPTAPAFLLPRDQLALLPFTVRLAKVARVAGVTPQDPLLSDLRASRLELGGADYANAVRPDRSWTAAKMVLWVKALKPVCASGQLSSRYLLPRDVPAFVLAAYGRRAEPADRALVDESLAGLTLTGAERHQAVCLALLSTAEFVSR